MRYGHLEILQWLIGAGYKLDADVCAYAARYGQLEILKWLRARGCAWDEDVCRVAAETGNLEVLKWLRDPSHYSICPINGFAWTRAAVNGQLHVLKWLHSNEQSSGNLGSDICASAVLGKHIEVLKWARSCGYVWDWRCVECAAANGTPEILQWLRENGAPE